MRQFSYYGMTALLLLMMPAAILAQTEVYCPSSNPHGLIVRPGVVEEIPNIGSKAPFWGSNKKRVSTPQKASANEVTVSFNVEYDPNVFNFYQILLIDDNQPYPYSIYDEGDGDYSTSLVPGTYDIVATFSKRPTPYYVILEKVEISEDSSFDINPEMATNHLKVVNYKPDGELMKHGLGYRDSETGEWIHTEDGDVIKTSVNCFVFLKESGRRLGGNNVSFLMDMGNEDDRSLSLMDFHVNDVSDRFLFTQFRMSQSEDLNTFYVNYFSTDNVHAGIIENNPSAYYLDEEVFEFSPDGKKNSYFGFFPFVSVLYDDKPFMALNSGMVTDDHNEKKSDELLLCKTYFNLPWQDNAFKFLVGFSVLDYMTYTEDQWGMLNETDYYMHGALHRIDNGQKEYLPIYNTYGSIAMPFNKIIPMHEGFSYKEDIKTGFYGLSCPINAVLVQNLKYPWSDDIETSWKSNYVGRLGETRQCDGASTMWKMKFNGEEIDDPSSWRPESNGVYEYEIINTNIVVDGLIGKNTTLLHYDLTKEKNTPPTMQMLMFKNKNGYITDKFSTGAEGIMEFSAAVFDYNIDIFYDEEGNPIDATYFYGCNPLNVAVEYSPYGKDDWNSMGIEEIPELFSDQGWGYFYHASLQDVQGEAEKGWFDVRFTMSDEAGNTHVQTVSPAFRIDELVSVGVESVNSEGLSVVGRYGLDGKQMNAPQKGINILHLQNGEVRKAFVR